MNIFKIVMLWLGFNSLVYALDCPYPVTGVVAHPVAQQYALVTLEWDAPITNDDGSLLDDLGGYTVYIGPDAGSLSALEDIPDPLATTHQLSLPVGLTFFGLTAWDTEAPRNESVMSNIVSKDIQ